MREGGEKSEGERNKMLFYIGNVYRLNVPQDRPICFDTNMF